jgi:MFS family permease
MNETHGARAVPPLRTRELGALALSIGLVPLNSTMLAVALPSIATEIGVEAAGLTQWLVAGYLLVGIALQSPAGKLSDAIGQARAIALGQTVFACGAVVGYLAHSVPTLVAARALMAAGGAVIVPSAMATLRVRLAPALRPRAFGRSRAVPPRAAALGPLPGGAPPPRLGWRSLFFVNAPPLAIAAALGWGAPKVAASGRPLRLDLVGSLLLVTALVLLVGATRAPSTAAIALAGVGVVTVAGFVAWERRARDPVIDFTLFRRRVFAAAVSIIGLQNLAMYALLFALPLVLSRAFGTGSKDAGRTLIAMTVAMVVASFSSGRIVERLGPRATARIGAATAVAGMLTAALTPLSGPRDLIPALVLLGVGLGLTTPPAQASGLDSVPAEKSGMAAGVSSTSRYLGGVAGVALVGGLLGSGDALARYRLAAWIFAGVLSIALAAASALPARVAARTAPAPNAR